MPDKQKLGLSSLHSNNKSSAAALERGVAAHRAGRIAEALVEYQAALAGAPEDAEIASLTGLALVHSGRATEALALLDQAVAAEPAQAGFRFNLVEGLIAARALDRAQRELDRLLADHPQSPQLLDRQGDIAMLRSDPEGAARAWQQVLGVGPRLAPGLKLARLQIALSHPDAADKTCKLMETHFSGDADVRALRRDLLVARRDWAALETFASAWLRSAPQQTDAWRALARAAFEQGRHLEAVAAFRRAIETTAASADDLASLAGLQLHALDFDAAAATLERVTALAPEHAGALSRQALLHLYYGRFDAAADCCRRSLARDPENVLAYSTLSRVQHGQLQDGDLAVLGRIAREPTAALDARIPAAFLVAHAADARGEIDAAFAAYEAAQSLMRERDAQEGRQYEASTSEARFERLARLPATDASAAIPDTPAPRPVFILGMPRSGTTLVECVLGAHSRVAACGERLAMRQLLRAALALDPAAGAVTAQRLRAWAAAYLRELPDLRGADHFTDKNPLNFEAVGLIARLFPQAAIIHVRRNPVETGLSIYRQEFGKPWSFARRLQDIGHFYGLQARLMHHWDRRLPGRIVTVQYEDFAADLERGARQLLEAVGLPWEPGCLEFQRAGRAIATFSAVEAREPVVVRAGRAIRYNRHLAPLIAALTAAGIDLATGALRSENRMDDPGPG